jgi:hypothetical protein
MSWHIQGSWQFVRGVHPQSRQARVDQGQVLLPRHCTEQLHGVIRYERKTSPTHAPVSSRSAALVFGIEGATATENGYRNGSFGEMEALCNLVLPGKTPHNHNSTEPEPTCFAIFD